MAVDKIGKYEVINLIAQGGMGAVYKGMHPTLNRPVILKKLTLKGNSTFAERFRREARIMMDFRNEHIVDVFDHFKEGQSFYIVLEYVDGAALDRLLRQERYLPNDVALLIFLDACRGLKYAHDKDVVHRDIKPGNILISKKGEIKLVDFGIATSKDDIEDNLTKDGMTLGTPSYMAPEQFANTKNVDKRADIYSMGVMLYEMVTGKKPFGSSFSPETLAMIQKGKCTPVQKINPKVLPLIKMIIKKSMHPKLKSRFQDLGDVIFLIEKHLKRLDVAKIKERLIKLVKGENPGPQPKKKVPLIKRILVSFFVFIILGLFLAGAVYFTNFHYEYLFAGNYGAVKVSVKVAKAGKNLEDMYLTAKLFKDDSVNIPALDNVKIVFSPNTKKETEAYYFLESGKIYLPSDHYRLKLNLENDLIWNSFFLNPRMIQKKSFDTKEFALLEFIDERIPAYPVDIAYTSIDQITGMEITTGTKLSVFNGIVWQEWRQADSEIVRSGANYVFKFEHEGYYPRIFDLFIKPFQNDLIFHTALIPVPAKVRFSTSLKQVSIKLNNSIYYRDGTQNGLINKIQAVTSKESRNISLAPGKYIINAGPYRNSVINYPMEISMGENINLDVVYDDGLKSLQIIEK